MPQYTGNLVPVGVGDEIAMNSVVLSVVRIDGAGNGLGLIKVPMMNNIKVGVNLSGIKVAEGGCIVAGRADLNGVGVSLLTDQQKAQLTNAYNILTTITQKAIENAGVVAETYNSYDELINKIKQGANSLMINLVNAISKKDLKKQQALEKAALEQINKLNDSEIIVLRKELQSLTDEANEIWLKYVTASTSDALPIIVEEDRVKLKEIQVKKNAIQEKIDAIVKKKSIPETILVEGIINCESEIMNGEYTPWWVPTGIKLGSSCKVKLKILNNKIVELSSGGKSTEFESPVLWGIKPAFTRISNFYKKISDDKKSGYVSYDVETQLSNFEVAGQFTFGLLFSQIVQTNIITVRQSILIKFEIDKITTIVDGSSFPEHRINAVFKINKDGKILSGNVKTTLHQSSYENAVKSNKFKDRNHKEKYTKILTF